MITAAQIAQGAITDTKVGKNANIKHSKLEKAGEGEVLVAQEDGRLKAVRVTGDARLSRSGKLTINLPESGEQSIVDTSKLVQKSDLKEGKTLVGGATRPEEVAVGSGANAIPQRDSSGNLKAETADQATTATNADNATLLNGNNMEYYRNVANHVAETATTSTDSNNNDTSQQRTPHKVFEFDVPSDSGSYSAAGTGPSNYPIEFTHNCGYIPDVSVYYKSNSAGASDPWEEVDAEVQNTTTTTKVQLSIQGANLKIVAK
tara:strand:+ start:2027 stop:2809 length:783 start_codon:yes stop_codon:yes gene_type:complete